MRNSVSRPNAVDFTEIVTARDRLSLEIDEQSIPADSTLIILGQPADVQRFAGDVG